MAKILALNLNPDPVSHTRDFFNRIIQMKVEMGPGIIGVRVGDHLHLIRARNVMKFNGEKFLEKVY